MKTATFTTLFLSLFIFASCGFNCVDGQGEITTKTIELDSFDEISLDISANVEVIQSGESKVIVETYQNILNELTFKISGGELDIDAENCINTDKDINIKIYTANLEEVTINGSGYLFSEDNIRGSDLTIVINGSGDVHLTTTTETLTCKINGSGDVNLSGKTDEFEVKINGSGEVNASKLNAEKKTVKINGSGDVQLSDCNNLETSVNGSGDVTCNPSK